MNTWKKLVWTVNKIVRSLHHTKEFVYSFCLLYGFANLHSYYNLFFFSPFGNQSRPQLQNIANSKSPRITIEQTEHRIQKGKQKNCRAMLGHSGWDFISRVGNFAIHQNYGVFSNFQSKKKEKGSTKVWYCVTKL